MPGTTTPAPAESDATNLELVAADLLAGKKLTVLRRDGIKRLIAVCTAVGIKPDPADIKRAAEVFASGDGVNLRVTDGVLEFQQFTVTNNPHTIAEHFGSKVEKITDRRGNHVGYRVELQHDRRLDGGCNSRAPRVAAGRTRGSRRTTTRASSSSSSDPGGNGDSEPPGLAGRRLQTYGAWSQ